MKHSLHFVCAIFLATFSLPMASTASSHALALSESVDTVTQDWEVHTPGPNETGTETESESVSAGTHTIKNDGRGSVKVTVYDEEGEVVKRFTLLRGKSKVVETDGPATITVELKTGRSASGTVTSN